MKKSFYLINFLLILAYFQSQSQPLGFVQQECGIISNPSYYIENYQIGSHGYGYKVYHNGTVIAEESTAMGAYSAGDLRFIDDTTGFFIVYVGAPALIFVYKIINNDVISLGSSLGWECNLFIVSRHTLYFISYFNPTNNLYINTLSDIVPQKLVYHNLPASDTTVIDTITGVPFCPDLSEINYLYKIANDTLTYTILFSVDTLNYIDKEKAIDIQIYPNPAKDFVRIKNTQFLNYCLIQIFDNFGILKKSKEMEQPGEIEICIDDLNPGIYFIVVDNKKTKQVYKLIKV